LKELYEEKKLDKYYYVAIFVQWENGKKMAEVEILERFGVKTSCMI